MDSLKTFLNSAAGQHIQRVYLNNKMEWLFAPRAGFETMLTRDDVLACKQTALQPPDSDDGAQIKVPAEKDKNAFNKSAKPKHSNKF